MSIRIFTKRTLTLLLLVGLASMSGLLYSFLSQLSISKNSASIIEKTAVLPTQQETIGLGLPVRLKIPSIQVDAAVEHVGVTPDGEMDVPKDHADVAWFNLGPRPGEDGSAVIAGHSGGNPSVFDNLESLRNGDKIFVEDDQGTVSTFVVRESRTFDSRADASRVFVSNDTTSHLNLITCEGVWNADSKSYSERLVVFAEKE